LNKLHVLVSSSYRSGRCAWPPRSLWRSARSQEERLRAAERLMARPDLAANLEPTDKEYVAAYQRQERAMRRRARRGKMLVTAASVIGVAALAYFKVLDPTYLEGQYNGVRNRMADANFKVLVLARRDIAAEGRRAACLDRVHRSRLRTMQQSRPRPHRAAGRC
jgi:hypothetical protein